MSFREAGSDVFRLNHKACREPVTIDAHTQGVLRRAIALSEISDGIFDITVAPELVARRMLPAPEHAPVPDADGSWRDIVFLKDHTIAFQRPLWIDLGGIAKGYAVDCAISALQTFSPARVCVNAGGDLRVAGIGSERIQLVPDDYNEDVAMFAEVENGSIASSCGRMAKRSCGAEEAGAHVDPRGDSGDGIWRFASVVAQDCVDADALTKVVMATGEKSASILAAYGACAQIYDRRFGWNNIGKSS